MSGLGNKDVIEWLLDNGIDTDKRINTNNGTEFISDMLGKHLGEQLALIKTKRGFVNEITKKELNDGYDHYLTVGGLKEFLNKHNLPETAKVLVQRIEDVYYEKHNWGVYFKKEEHAFKDDDGNVVKSSMEQYRPAWCCVKYNDEDNVLFIDLHY